MDRIFDGLVLDEHVALVDVWGAAAGLLAANYDASLDEFSDLLSLTPGENVDQFVSTVLDALFATEPRPRSYTSWVRASLTANSLGSCALRSDDLANVLETFIVNGRATPVQKFVGSCLASAERSSLENLV